MSAPAIYRMLDHYKGDTFDGVRFSLFNKSDESPIDLTNTNIKIQFRKDKIDGTLMKEVTIGYGITLITSEQVYNDETLEYDTVTYNNVLQIDPFLLDWEQRTYYYDVEVTFSNGVVKTYIKGTQAILQDTSY